jgi:hypothetical protein
LASSAFKPPYWLRQRWKVASLIPSFWQTWWCAPQKLVQVV